ncbi:MULTISPECIES: hypothetical protein [unclassified Paenibacillus]|nr:MULTISPECIES: hypothetical protein [unclassified Paenibacillus]MBP1157114.1 hypothetical protein [Paenibacillus sp. PvP091]MBP1172147.1 hypothetical protein [Paenibacillus sp. PvR098]MBP2438528.1 hypothetical protein [Paenibacillus sp. PvP052]
MKEQGGETVEIMTDEQLVELVLQGDHEAYRVLMEQQGLYLYTDLPYG